MVVNERPTKRARRRVTADLPDLFTFPPPPQSPDDGPFRDNVRDFLGRHARVTLPSSSLFPSLLTWQIALRVGPPVDPAVVVLPLDIVEEDVTRSRRSVYCDQCRVVGESNHRLPKSLFFFFFFFFFEKN